MNIEWNRTSHVAVAVSGGVDSMVLLDMVRKSGHYQSLTILHVNHNLRSQSIVEEQMIADYAAHHNLALYVTKIPADALPKGKSIQADAREYRYQFFERIMATHAIDVLLTAHHQDDAAETILFRLLSGRYHYQYLSIGSSFPIYRPLLSTPKAQIYKYAAAHNVPFMEDDSNKKNDYTRNAIRNEILPHIKDNPHLHLESLISFAEWQKEIMEMLQSEAEIFIGNYSNEIDRTAFNQLKQPVKPFVLIYWLEQKLGHPNTISHHYLQEIIRVIQTDVSQATYDVTCEWSIDIVYDKLRVRKKELLEHHMVVSSPGKYQFNNYEIQLQEQLESPLTIRTKSAGDRIKIGQHHQKVNRIMIDSKVPNNERIQTPIILYEDEIIAVGDLKQSNHEVLSSIKICKRSDNDA